MFSSIDYNKSYSSIQSMAYIKLICDIHIVMYIMVIISFSVPFPELMIVPYVRECTYVRMYVITGVACLVYDVFLYAFLHDHCVSVSCI